MHSARCTALGQRGIWRKSVRHGPAAEGSTVQGNQLVGEGQVNFHVAENERRVVRRVGIEPTTYGLRVHCSTN